MLATAAKEAAGEAEILIDAGFGYGSDAKTAIGVARELEQLGVFWLEEPFDPDEYEAYAELADTVDIRVAAGEQDTTVWGFRELIERGHVDLVQPDVTRCGGITEWLRIAELAREHGVETVPHAWKSGIIKAASLQCNAVIPDALFQEYCVADTPINQTLTHERLPLEDGGFVRVPTAPGIGVTLDDEVVERYRVRLRDETEATMAVTPDTDLAARAAAVIPGGVNSGQRRVPGLEDLVVTATSGATFTDAEGRTYTDYHAAFGPPLLGHNDPDVDAAVAATARSVGLMGVGVTPVEIELAERLVRARAVGRARAAHRDGQRGDLPRDPRRARGDRAAAT